MFEEKQFRPLEADIARDMGQSGRDEDTGAEVVGLDFEVGADGYCKTIYSSGDPPYVINSSADVLDWLAKEDPRYLFVAKADWLGPLLKWFGDCVVKEYLRARMGYRMNFGSVHISYLPSGYASVLFGSKGRKKVRCLYPFYHMYGLPPEVDSDSIQYMADRIIKTLRRYDMPFGGLKSPGGILQSYLTRSGMKGVSVGRIPEGALNMAANCYHTMWVVAVVLGYVNKAWDYDISSAFPYHTSQLVACDPVFGRWFQSSLYQKDAAYGFCKCIIELHAPITPMLFRLRCEYLGFGKRDIKQANWVGKYSGWLTKREIDFIRRNGIGKVEIEDAWWFVASSEFHPFEYSMKEFFGARAEARSIGDKYGQNLCKLVGLTAQGKAMSSFPLFGKLVGGYMRNPIYAADITSATRVQLGEFCLDNWEHLLHVTVDGAVLDAPVDVPGGVGQFRTDSPEAGEECVVARDGQYWMPSRKSVFQKDTLVEFAEQGKYPDKRVLGRYSLGEVASNKCDFSFLGQMRGAIPMIEVAGGEGWLQRNFPEKPSVCSDLLTKQYISFPRSVK